MIVLISRLKAAMPGLFIVLLACSGTVFGATTLATPKELSDAIYAGNTQPVARYLNGGGDPNVCVPIRPPKHVDPAWSVSARWCEDLGRLLIAEGDTKLALLALHKGALEKHEQIQDALGVAIRAQLPEVVKALITRGANVNKRAGVVDQPLWEAADAGNLPIVEVLVKAGADINATDSLGDTPIGAALEKGHEEIADYLVQNGAALNMETSNGYQLISVAAIGGSAKFVSALAMLGFDVNVEDINGETPLFFTLYDQKIPDEKRRRMVSVLLHYGADACHRDHDGHTALDYAKKLKNSGVVKILQKAQRTCENR